MEIDIADVLTCAKLPAGLFNRKEVVLTQAEYFQLWGGIETAAGERSVALLLAEKMNIESFDPAIFACICSPDLNTALNRLRLYKPLIGPMALDVEISGTETRLRVGCYGDEGELPGALANTEVVFITQLARLATRSQIEPLSIQLPELPTDLKAFTEYFGCLLTKGPEISVSFSAKDASRPFLTSNASMWDFFEGILRQRLKDLDDSASTVDRVKAVLMETLPAGGVSMDEIANKLAMSKRSLQRRLTDEAETFQSVLQRVRAELADHYLMKSQLSLGEISFMLGFQEQNSFIRAYSAWNGVSPGQFRERPGR